MEVATALVNMDIDMDMDIDIDLGLDYTELPQSVCMSLWDCYSTLPNNPGLRTTPLPCRLKL